MQSEYSQTGLWSFIWSLDIYCLVYTIFQTNLNKLFKNLEITHKNGYSTFFWKAGSCDSSRPCSHRLTSEQRGLCLWGWQASCHLVYAHACPEDIWVKAQSLEPPRLSVKILAFLKLKFPHLHMRLVAAAPPRHWGFHVLIQCLVQIFILFDYHCHYNTWNNLSQMNSNRNLKSGCT